MRPLVEAVKTKEEYMKVLKGQMLKVHDSRKGDYIAVASADFDTVADDWYPVHLAQDQPLNGMQGRPKWFKGEDVPCRRGQSDMAVLLGGVKP